MGPAFSGKTILSTGRTPLSNASISAVACTPWSYHTGPRFGKGRMDWKSSSSSLFPPSLWISPRAAPSRSQLSTLNRPPALIVSGRKSREGRRRQGDDLEFQDGPFHRLHLLADDTGKPSQELIHRGAVFEVLKKRAHRHPCGFENPGAAHLPGHPFDRRTLSPIQHRQKHMSTPAARQAFAGERRLGVARVR